VREEPCSAEIIFHCCSCVADPSDLAISTTVCITACLGVLAIAFRADFLAIIRIASAIVIALTALVCDISRTSAGTDPTTGVSATLGTRNGVKCGAAAAYWKAFLSLNVADPVQRNIDALFIGATYC